MSDYSASPVAAAFWSFEAYPGHPVVVRLVKTNHMTVATYEVPRPARITPETRGLAKGLYIVFSSYLDANGVWHERGSYFLINGPYSILSLSDGLGAAVEGVINSVVQ